ARLARAAVDAGAQLVRGSEVFGEAMTAGGVAVMLRYAIPEEGRGREVAWVFRIRVPRRGPDQFGDLAVAVLSGKNVLVALERVGELVMLEAIREIEPPLVARVDVEVGQHLVHAAVLGVEHFGNLHVAERLEHAFGPRGELRLDVERRLVPSVAI